MGGDRVGGASGAGDMHKDVRDVEGHRTGGIVEPDARPDGDGRGGEQVGLRPRDRQGVESRTKRELAAVAGEVGADRAHAGAGGGELLDIEMAGGDRRLERTGDVGVECDGLPGHAGNGLHGGGAGGHSDVGGVVDKVGGAASGERERAGGQRGAQGLGGVRAVEGEIEAEREQLVAAGKGGDQSAGGLVGGEVQRDGAVRDAANESVGARAGSVGQQQAQVGGRKGVESGTGEDRLQAGDASVAGDADRDRMTGDGRTHIDAGKVKGSNTQAEREVEMAAGPGGRGLGGRGREAGGVDTGCGEAIDADGAAEKGERMPVQ